MRSGRLARVETSHADLLPERDVANLGSLLTELTISCEHYSMRSFCRIRSAQSIFRCVKLIYGTLMDVQFLVHDRVYKTP
jgi:hypothetical protein